MGQCCSKQNNPKKQNKNEDSNEEKMFKAAVKFMDKEFSVGIGYNRKAKSKKNYSDVVHVDNTVPQILPNNERERSEDHQTETQVQEF